MAFPSCRQDRSAGSVAAAGCVLFSPAHGKMQIMRCCQDHQEGCTEPGNNTGLDLILHVSAS